MNHRRTRVFWLLLAITGAVTLALAPQSAGADLQPCTTAVGHATLVVEHSDGSVLQRCVAISGSSASGMVVLENSGVQYGTVGYGGGLGDELCQVDNEPQNYPPNCLAPGKPYWVIFIARGGGSWQESAQGLSSLQLASGDALGLRYDEQGGTPAAPASRSIQCPPPPAPTAGPPTTAAAATPPAAASGSGGSSAPPVSSGAPSNSSSPSPSPTGVVAALLPSAATRLAPLAPANAGGGPSPLWLVLSACIGVLVGRLAIQVMRRRKP